MKSTYFYFTPEDWWLINDSISKENRFSYFFTGLFPTKTTLKYSSLLEIPFLGISQHGKNVLENTYLIIDTKNELEIRDVPQKTGSILYAIDQLVNPFSVALRPCGLFKDNIMIFGEISTVHKNEASLSIYKIISTIIKKNSIKIQSFYLSQNSMGLFNKGLRFTSDYRSPNIYDLKKV